MQANFLGNLVGSRWNYNFRGQTFQFNFGQTSIDNFSNGFWPGVSWQPNGVNQLRLWDTPNNRAMNLSFNSPDSFTGNDWDGSPISGNRIGNANNNTNNGQSVGKVFDVLPRVAEMTSTDRPDFQAVFSSPADRRTLRFLVDNVDHSPELSYFSNDKMVRWTPAAGMAAGNHKVDVRATGTNGESLTGAWTFSTPGSFSPPNPQPNVPVMMRVNNLNPGEILGSHFSVDGQGVPGSRIVVQVEYPKQDILSQLAGANLRFQAQGTVASNGAFSIPVNAQEVPRGQPMTITITDSANSPIVSMKTERGPDNQFQQSNQNQGQQNSLGGKYYDQQNNFGLDIPAGWSRSTPAAGNVLRVNNGPSIVEVAVGPAQRPQDAVASLKNGIVGRGGQLTGDVPTKIAGMGATRVGWSKNNGQLQGTVCRPGLSLTGGVPTAQ